MPATFAKHSWQGEAADSGDCGRPDTRERRRVSSYVRPGEHSGDPHIHAHSTTSEASAVADSAAISLKKAPRAERCPHAAVHCSTDTDRKRHAEAGLAVK